MHSLVREGGLDSDTHLFVFSPPEVSLLLFPCFKTVCKEEKFRMYSFVRAHVCVCAKPQTCNQESPRIKGPPVIKELAGG